MQASLAKLRHFILVTLIFSLLFFVTYFNKSPQVTVGKSLDEQKLLKTIKKGNTVCDLVDIQWL
jgi:fumarate reductase subunit C